MYYFIYSALLVLAWWNVINPSNNIFICRKKTIRVSSSTCLSFRYNILLSCIFVFLIIIAGFRWNVGFDFNTYVNEYRLIQSGASSYADISFIILAKIVPNITWIFFIYAFISLVLYYLVLLREKSLLYVILLLFFSCVYLRFEMGIMRQGLSLALTLMAFQNLEKKKKLEYISLIIIAMLIHGSAIIFVLSTIVTRTKFDHKVMIIILFACIFVGFTDLWTPVLNIFGKLPIPMMGKYMSYLKSGHYTSYDFGFDDIKIFVFLIFFFYSSKFISKENKQHYENLINIYYIGACISYFFRPFLTLSDRGAFYFTICEILIFPIIILELRKKQSYRIGLMILIALYSFHYIYIYSNAKEVSSWMNAPYVPYHWVFSSM